MHARLSSLYSEQIKYENQIEVRRERANEEKRNRRRRKNGIKSWLRTCLPARLPVCTQRWEALSTFWFMVFTKKTIPFLLLLLFLLFLCLFLQHLPLLLQPPYCWAAYCTKLKKFFRENWQKSFFQMTFLFYSIESSAFLLLSRRKREERWQLLLKLSKFS